MITDILYKLLRKSLTPLLYRRVARSVLGRGRAYHRPHTYLDIFSHYRERGLDFRGKTVLECGPGGQFFTAFSFISEGAMKVLLVDPVIDPEALPAQVATYEATVGFKLPADAASRIECYRDLSEVPGRLDGTVDTLCSNHVLEHVSDLDSFFRNNHRLLSPAGRAYHRVDVSDHTYHVFDKFRITRNINQKRSLFHLRYSKAMFRFLNDGKCYMNRAILPVHRRMAVKNGLAVEDLRISPYRKIPIHPELLAELGDCKPEDLFLTEFSIILRKSAGPTEAG